MGFQFQPVAGVAPLLGRELAMDETQSAGCGLSLLPGVVIALPGGGLASGRGAL
jgi:hypothetical protein